MFLCRGRDRVKIWTQSYWFHVSCRVKMDLLFSSLKCEQKWKQMVCIEQPCSCRIQCIKGSLKAMDQAWGVDTAAAKSLQSCPTLCDPIDGSPPGSPVPGILQARTLEWFAISFSNAWKWKWSRSVASDSSRPHGLQPTRLLRPWDSPGKSTGVGCHRSATILCYWHKKYFITCFASTYWLKNVKMIT